MAGHGEIKVGSTDWVVRIAGEDVRVKVMDKVKKASGRGYEFSLRRIGPDGQVHGRALVRGSGALRRPGDPVKEFGGKAKAPPRRQAAPKKAPNPFAPAARPAAKAPARRAPVASGKASAPGRPRVSPEVSSVFAPVSSVFAPQPAAPALPSLRGRRREAPAASAPAAPKKESFQFRCPNELVKKVMRSLEKLPKEADTPHVRNTVAAVLAEHERSKYFTPLFRR